MQVEHEIVLAWNHICTDVQKPQISKFEPATILALVADTHFTPNTILLLGTLCILTHFAYQHYGNTIVEFSNQGYKIRKIFA